MTGNPPATQAQTENAPSLAAQVLAVLWADRFLLAASILILSALIFAASYLALPVRYASTATLLVAQPKTRQTDFASLLGQLALPDRLSEAFGPRANDKADVILAFLESRTLAQALLTEHGLLRDVYDTPWQHALGLVGLAPEPNATRAIQEGRVRSVLSAAPDTGGVRIDVRLKASTPDKASEVCAAALAELDTYLAEEHQTESNRERRFVEDQLAEAQAALATWEDRVPSPRLSLARIQRELTSAARLVADLQQRLALARIAEARDEVAYSLLDAPLVPVKPAGPRKALRAAVAVTLASCFGLALAFTRRLWPEIQTEARRLNAPPDS